MKTLNGQIEYDQVLKSLEKLTRECNLVMYEFKAAQYDVLEIRRKESQGYNCVGFYTLSTIRMDPKFYQRTLGMDTVGDHLFRVHGPDHPYGRGSDEYLEGLKGFGKNRSMEKRIWKDLNHQAENTDHISKILAELIDKRLLLKEKSTKSKHNLDDMQ